MTAKGYVWIWVWLAGLMLAGVAVSYLPNVTHQIIVLAVLALSTIKAMLVAGYYMHLKFDSRFLTLVAVLPIPLVFFLAVILLLDFP